MFFLILGITSLVLILASFLFIYFYEKKKTFIKNLNLRLILIRLPRSVESHGKEKDSDWKEEVNLMSQLFSALAGLRESFVFEVAVPNVGEEISFYLTVSRGKEEFAIRQIQGLWKDAQADLVSDFNIFHPDGVATAVYLQEKKSYVLPIRTCLEAGVDTFSTIISNMTKIQIAGEGIALQVVVKPASSSWEN